MMTHAKGECWLKLEGACASNMAAIGPINDLIIDALYANVQYSSSSTCRKT
jgi:hypothetical protein